MIDLTGAFCLTVSPYIKLYYVGGKWYVVVDNGEPTEINAT